VARPSYKSEKRKKEIQRQKKQEEKRQKRFNKASGQDSGLADAATLEGLGLVPPPSESAAADETKAEGGETAGEGGDKEPSEGPQA